MNTSKKKILLISPDFPPPLVGGSLVWLLNLLTNCPEDFDILTGPKDDSFQEIFQDSKRKRIYRSMFIKDSHDPSKFQLLLMYFYMPLWMVIKNFKENYSAVLVNPGAVGNSILFLVGKIFNIKVIGVGHGEEITVPLYGKGLKNFIKRLIIKFSYKYASGFIVVCHFCKRLLNDLNVKNEMIDVIPSCLNPNKFKNNHSAIKQKFKIISVGRLIERKGFHFLIDAVNLLKEEIPEIKLEIVGDGPYKNILEQKIIKNNASSYIRLAGQISDNDLVKIYETSSLFVLAHTLLENGDTEGCPTVFSEAMGYGLPLIGGTGAGADTAIIEGKNGFIVNSKNIKEIAEAIKKILLNPVLSQEMSTFGKQKLAKDHDPVKNGLALQKSLTRMINLDLASGYQKELNERS